MLVGSVSVCESEGWQHCPVVSRATVPPVGPPEKAITWSAATGAGAFGDGGYIFIVTVPKMTPV